MLSPNKYRLKLISLTCHLTDENDADEVFLIYNQNKLWPADKKFFSLKNGKIPIDISIDDLDKDSSLSFELWDYDRFSSNDNIGLFTMLVNERGGPFFTDLSKFNLTSKAKYTLEWEVS